MQASWGDMPIFIRFASNGLAFTSVLLLVLAMPATAYLFTRPNKRRATWWLAIFMVCVDLALMTMLIVNSVVLFGPALNPLQDVFVTLGSIALVRFAYNFPRMTRPRAANRVSAVLVVLTAAGAVYAVAYAVRAVTQVRALYGDVPPVAPLFYLLMPAAIAIVTAVFIVRAVETARAGATDRSRYEGWRGALRALISPPDRTSHAQRNFALAVVLGTVQAGASFLAAYMYTPLAMASISLGALVALAAILLVYLNSAMEPHSLVVRLMGITLVCLLGVLTLVGQTSINVQAYNLERYNIAFLRMLANYDAIMEAERLDPNILLIHEWDAEAVRAGTPGPGRTTLVRAEVADGNIPGLLEAPVLPAELPPDEYYVSHPLILREDPPRLSFVYYLEDQGRVVAVVAAGQLYAKAVHELNRGLMLATLLGAIALAALVPLLVRSGMIAPLRQLVAGIRRADRGDLTTPVPVQHDDEIGFVTASFNRTIESVRATQQALLEANERQEAIVEQRTAQLAAALDAAEEAKRAAEQSEQKAYAASEAKSIFLANVSHELRSPLTSILGYSDLLAREGEMSEEQRRIVATIKRSADHLLEIVDDVLELRKVEAGQVELHRSAFRLTSLAQQLDDMFRSHADAKELTFSVSAEPGNEVIETDQRKLRQIAVNLISNAIKFTQQGEVRVSLRTVAEPQAEPQAEPRAEPQAEPGSTADGAGRRSRRRLLLDVQDTGMGIPPADAEAIWQPFHRVNPLSPNAGAGLGLPISKEFAHLLGGELTMRSMGVPGEGAAFHLDIPVDVVELSRTAVPILLGELPGTSPATHARILVVEDQAENRELLARILQTYGIAVEGAADGNEAIGLCMKFRPHLIFMDIRMPELDGRSAATRIRELCHRVNPAGDGPKIIALTAHAFEEQRQQILDWGFDDLVRKPYRRQDITAALERHLHIAMPLTTPLALPLVVPPAAGATQPVAGGETERLDRFLHDVRNPLTTIGLSAEMALDLERGGQTPQPEVYREYLERIERNARMIEEMMGDLRTRTRGQTRDRESKP